MRGMTQDSQNTPERIRDSAIAEFAAHGFSSTTVRSIEKAAGISPGLVIHHFGSKENLRTVCDDYVLSTLPAIKREHAGSSPVYVNQMLKDDSTRTFALYMLKSISDPSEQGQRLSDHYVQVTEPIIDEGFAGFTFRKYEDRAAQAAALSILGLAPLMLGSRIRPMLGTNDLASTFERISAYLTSIYLHGVIESAPASFESGSQCTSAKESSSP